MLLIKRGTTPVVMALFGDVNLIFSAQFDLILRARMIVEERLMWNFTMRMNG